MKLFIALVVIAASLHAQSTKPPDKKSEPKKEWKTYGATIDLKKATPLPALLKSSSSSKEVLLEGTISEVCQHKGCWMMVADGKIEILVQFKDYGFFVPRDSEGKTVRLQGTIERKAPMCDEAADLVADEKPKDQSKAGESIEIRESAPVFTAAAVAILGGGEIPADQQEVIDAAREQEGAHHEHQHDHE